MRVDLFNQTYTSQAAGIDIIHIPVGIPSNIPVGISFGVAPVPMKFYAKNYVAGTEIDASNTAGMVLRGDFGGGITCHTGSSNGFVIQTDGNSSGGFNCNMDVGSPIFLTSGNSTGDGNIIMTCDGPIVMYVNHNINNNSNMVLQNQSPTGGVVTLTNYNYLMHIFLDSGINNRLELQNTEPNGDIFATASRDIVLSAGRNLEIGAPYFRWFINTNNPTWGSEIVISEAPSNFIRISNYFTTGSVNKQYILLDTASVTGNLDIVNDLPNPNNIRIINKQQSNNGTYCGLYLFGDNSAPNLPYGMDWVGSPSGNTIDIRYGSGLAIDNSYGGGVNIYIASSSGWTFNDNAISNGGINSFLQEGYVNLNAMSIGLCSGYGTSVSNPTGMVLTNHKGYSLYVLPNSLSVNAGITISNNDSLVSANTVINSGLGTLYNFALGHYMYAYSTGNNYADVNIYASSEEYSHTSLWIKNEDRVSQNSNLGDTVSSYIVFSDSTIDMHYFHNNMPSATDLGNCHFNFTPQGINLSHSHPTNNHYGAINWNNSGNAYFGLNNQYGNINLSYYSTGTGNTVNTVWNATELLSGKQTYIKMTPAPNGQIELYGNIVLYNGNITQNATEFTQATINITATNVFSVIVCKTTSNPITVNLPDISTLQQGATYKIKNVDINLVTINAYAGQTIDGVSSTVLSQWKSVEIMAVFGATYYWVIL
jgi:hypothetical protein